MNIAYSWLKDYIDLKITPEEVSAALTQIGLETGSIEEVETVKGGLKGLVIGHVLTCKEHPDSDHLHVTTVDVGNGTVLPIVCGAPNVAAGQKVVVATVGTTLYDGDKEFKIKKSKIRGEVSEGMICAEDEIGLGNDHSGIMVLDKDAVVGSQACDYFKVGSDYVLEVDLTPNRIDAGSYIGVARDLAAFLKQSDKKTVYTRPDISAFAIDNHDAPIDVVVENAAACHRYAGITITGLEIKESPEWLKKRIRLMGLNPINNVVDATNYVLFETGQPLHAFDLAKVEGNKIVVKTLPQGTKFVTLDGVERELNENDLMICNTKEAMCLAGVFGGLKSGVSNETTSIFLESAWFDPVYIRKTARRNGLNTDASFRFERGVDPNGVMYALKRAALIIKEVAGGKVSSDIVDIYPEPAKFFDVELTYSHLKKLTGIDIAPENVKSILEALEIEIVSEGEDRLSLKVPPYRVDVQREADVVEDILRIYGYDKVEVSSHVNSTIQYSPKPNPEKLRNIVSDMLSNNGFYEMWSNSLTKSSYYDNLDVLKADETVKIFNPLSSDLNAMRQSLLFGGLEAIARNRSYQNSDLRLYEFGNIYKFIGGEYVKSPVEKYFEEMHLALFVTGDKCQENWTTKSAKSSFFSLKMYVEQILNRIGVATDKLRVESFSNDLFSEGISYQRGDGKIIVELGFVNNKRLKEADIDVPVYYADFSWSFILKAVAGHKIAFTELAKFPSVRRDLALLVDENVSFSQLKAIALKTEKKLLRNVDIFDVYKGNKLPAGKKSYALSFVLRDDERTLNDAVIDKTMQRFIEAFDREVGAKIR